MKRLLFTILLVLAAFGTVSAQPLSDNDFLKQNRLARVYEETRDIPSAARLYTELHKARPGATDVSESLFRCLYALKRYAEADTLLTERIAHERESLELYLNLARVRSKLNRKSDALEAFAHAAKFGTGPAYFPNSLSISQTMIEIGYQEEALAFLIRQRENSEESYMFTDQIAGLYFKIGKYEEGTKEYLAMLKNSEQNLSIVEQRIAQFTVDTSVRRSIVKIVTSHIDIDDATFAELRLVAWCCMELKDYKQAFEIYKKLDDLAIKRSSAGAGGYELLQFADRIRNEGALDYAIKAYDEAMKRFREGAAKDPLRRNYVRTAELGVLRAKEDYWRSVPDVPADTLEHLLTEYRDFAKSQVLPDLAFEALLRGGELSFKILRNYPVAQLIYENILASSQAYNDKTRDAYFALEEIALAQGDLSGAALRLDVLSDVISRRNRPLDSETVKHILLERARIDYYNGAFDSCLSKLALIIVDPNSDFTNDAIALHSLITENTGNNPALQLFAKAELKSLGKDLNAALSAYRSIPESYPTATIADESVMRAVEILIQMKKPNDALGLLANMQEKMTTSPLLDKAVFREAEIVETILKDKARAQRMYEDFLERYPKSPLCTEARKKARMLRGDTF